MEFPEPYHSLPIRDWRKHMKAHPYDYATIGVRAWLRNLHKCILICVPVGSADSPRTTTDTGLYVHQFS
jgi:hypothetical protein